MDITIKLLHERRNSNRRRKINGKSGKVYQFNWTPEYSAYTYATSSQDDIDDIFESQGRSFGSYFAPVITFASVPIPSPAVPPVPAVAVVPEQAPPSLPLRHEEPPKGKVPPKTPPLPPAKPRAA